MKTIDLHCDTLRKAYIRSEMEDALYSCDEFAVDLKRLHEAGSLAQFFAVFMSDCHNLKTFGNQERGSRRMRGELRSPRQAAEMPPRIPSTAGRLFCNAASPYYPEGTMPKGHCILHERSLRDGKGCRQATYGGLQEKEKNYFNSCVEICRACVSKHGDIAAFARRAEDLLHHYEENKVSVILSLEDADLLHGRLDNVQMLYDLGFRAVGLTWNYENCLGYPNSTEGKVMEKGLKPFGKEAVQRMLELGILVDVSHLSDGGFWDVMELADKPVVATHSNARGLCRHPRNLSDEMIHALAENGGVMGLNFYPSFLEEGNHEQKSRISAMVEMAKYERKMGGIDIIALGTDFDGMGGKLEIANPLEMDRLEDALRKNGFTSLEIEKIFWRNALRVFQAVW